MFFCAWSITLGDGALLGLELFRDPGLHGGLALGHLAQTAGQLGCSHRRATPAQEQQRDDGADGERREHSEQKRGIHGTFPRRRPGLTLARPPGVAAG
jgi:hypothetical protein